MLRRLDARMMEYTHGEIGWDVFTLEYKVDSPVNTVLDADSMMNYLKIFNHLWKIKRVESALSVAWMRTAGGSRTFLRLPGANILPWVPMNRTKTSSLVLDLNFQWHKIRLVMAEMIHFVRQTQAYCQVEVIGCSWEALHQFIQQKKGDLDSLIDAHRSYLDRIVKKVLLLTHKAGREVGTMIFVVTLPDTRPGEFTQSNEGAIHDHPTVPRVYGQFRPVPSRLHLTWLNYRTTFIITACLNLPVGMLSVT